MPTTKWSVRRSQWGRYCHLPRLGELGLPHGFSCRDLAADAEPGQDGVAAVLAEALDLGGLHRARLRQKHTRLVHRLAAPRPWEGPAPVGDALLALQPGWVLTLLTADCLPLLILDPDGGAYAAVHAGWRGTLAGVLDACLEELPGGAGRAWVAVGPGIRSCCFEVGEEVAAAFQRRWAQASSWLRPGARSRPHLDLVAANRLQATERGVSPDRFLDAALCTRCRRDLFFSHRGDGGGTGRVVTLAGTRARGG